MLPSAFSFVPFKRFLCPLRAQKNTALRDSRRACWFFRDFAGFFSAHGWWW